MTKKKTPTLEVGIMVTAAGPMSPAERAAWRAEVREKFLHGPLPPSPWLLKVKGDIDSDLTMTVNDASGNWVFFHGNEPYEGPHVFDNMAIARLTTAAPELLECVKLAIMAYDHGLQLTFEQIANFRLTVAKAE